VDYRVAKSVNDDRGAVITGKADIACGVAFTWGRSTQVTYSLPFDIGGTRLLMASDRYGSFNLGNLKDLSLVESTHTKQFRRLMTDRTSGVDTCHKSCEYFGLCGGGNGSNKFWEHGTLASSETNACHFGTQIPTQVLLERFEEGPPLTSFTSN